MLFLSCRTCPVVINELCPMREDMSLSAFVSEVRFHNNPASNENLEGDTSVRIQKYRRRGSDDLVREDGPSTAHTTLSSAPSSSFKANTRAKPKRSPNYLAEDAIQREHEFLRSSRSPTLSPPPATPPQGEISRWRDNHVSSFHVAGANEESEHEVTSETSMSSSEGVEQLQSHFDPNNWMLSSPQRRCRVLSSTLNEINQSLAPSVISNHHHHHHRVERLETAPFPGPIDPPLAPHEEGVSNSVRKSKWPLPKYMHNIIVHQQMHEKKPQDESKLMRQLAKSIMLPDDPSDPAAFTVTPGLTRPPKPPWCSSKPVLKIVGTFAFMMSLGIIIAIIYLNWYSNTFRPMDM